MSKDEYEVIIVSDNSSGNIDEVIEPLRELPHFTLIKMKHPYGMRGCTFAFNTAFKIAQGEVIAETTPETMIPPDTLEIMYEKAMAGRNFCAFKTYNLTPELQLKIDTVDWESDINNIKKLEGFDNPWTMNNIKFDNFVTHQTCAIKNELFFELFPNGFPLFGGYGDEDPYYAGVREQNNVQGITIMEPMAFHQWHPPFQYWQSKGLGPNLNKWAHSKSNYMNDKSGKVPEGGGRYIWDMEHESVFNTPEEMLSDGEIDQYSTLDDIVRKTGCKII